MSQENVEAAKRLVDANNRRDVDGMLAELDPAVEWHDAAPILLGGETTVYRGHEGARALLNELWDVLDETYVELREIRDLGDRIVTTGELRTRGRGSGIAMESPYGTVSDFENGKAIRIWTYLDVDEALEAAGLRE
jgi:ketosteroid isomerase-like protein